MNNDQKRNDFNTGAFKRDILIRPTCPFCGLDIERPKELDTRRPREMPIGSCTCGAVYAFDITGHNLGAAYAEALVFACNMDWDLAWDLLPGEDYLQGMIEKYDLESNLIVPTGAYGGRRVAGALYFIRLHKDIQEATQEGVQEKLEKAKEILPDHTVKPVFEKKYSKKEIEKLVKEYQLGMLLEIAARDKRILRDLQRLLYSGDELLLFRTAEILGQVSAVVAKKNPEAVSKLLQRLFNAYAEPGTSGWGAIDSIGEIIANSPNVFAGYMSMLYQSLDDELLRPRVLRALANIAKSRAELIQKSKFFFLPFLSDPNPETRGYTAMLLGNLGVVEARKDLERIREDVQEIDIYENGQIVKKSIGQLAAEALEKI